MFLDYAKKVSISRKASSLFYEEASRIQDSYEEIDSKKAHLKNKICQIEETRIQGTLTLLKKSLGFISNLESVVGEIETKCLPQSSSYLKSLFDLSNSFSNIHPSKEFFSLPRSIDNEPLPEIAPLTGPASSTLLYDGHKDILEKISFILKEEENVPLISPNAQVLLSAIQAQLQEEEGQKSHINISDEKSEYERMRISSYRNKSISPNSQSTTITMQYSPIEQGPLIKTSRLFTSPKLIPSITHSPISSFAPGSSPDPCESKSPTKQLSSFPEKYIALYDSTAETKEELSFSKGDCFNTIDGTDDSSDSEWIYLIHISTGQKGYVPRSYLQSA